MAASEDKQFEVIGMGGAAWDILGIVEHYPQPGEKSEFIAYEEQGGGQAATAMVAVARLGGRAAIMGTNGTDEIGAKIRQGFVEEGVDASWLLERPGGSSHVAYCMVDQSTGDRTIFFTRGDKRRLQPEELDRDFILSGRCFLCDTHHWQAAGVAGQWAREAGLPVVTDLERDTPGNDTLFRRGTHHIIPEHYLLEYFGESDRDQAVQALWRRYEPEVVVVTRGPEGAIAYTGQEELDQPAYPVEEVVDTTGAGDVYHGAFAYGLTLGYDLPTNLEFAALVAGLKCRRLGGRAGIPTAAELAELWSHPLS